ncbi:MAG: short-chain dehydrogenase/reductase, partial [Verrucomicrobia bacterium]|nr:short-chain dehydrogenase/reductase [Verrucomicrobiota bacterium]
EGGQIIEIPDEQWLEVFEMYFLSVVRMSRLVVPLMEGQGGGAIVNITGASALEPDMRFPVADTIRASMTAYTKLFARTYAEKKIRMNNVAPSVVFDHDPAAVPARLKRELAIRRPAQCAEAANAVAFLLSDEASYISGETLKVDAAQTRGL